MSALNKAQKFHEVTAGGSPAFPHLTAAQRLRRSVMSCLLWESEFYEDGQTIADRICEHASAVSPEVLASVAIEARAVHNLRHVPLLLVAELAKRGGPIVSDTLAQVIRRADELNEFMSIYWRNGKTPLAKQVKKGLALAFQKFDAYQLAKYDREKAVRLRDVLFMVHAKPKDDAQAAMWKQLVDGTLPSPDTWEVAMSGGGDKREEFTRLLTEKKLGYFALLRNLRNMVDAGVDTDLIRQAILAREGGADKILPFRYIAAARACPRLELEIDQSLKESVSISAKLNGETIILVDVSGSMATRISAKSDLTRMDAAAALASVINGNLRVLTFSDRLIEVAPRRGMAGVDAIIKSQPHKGTALAEAITHASKFRHDRLIVITDEQATTGRVPDPMANRSYMINVASNKNGVGYGKWTHIDGFSEGVIRWIHESERDAN